MTFEEGMKELDEIIQKLEGGKVGLAEGTKLFERGNKLVEDLYNEFTESKGKIFVIKENIEKFIDKK